MIDNNPPSSGSENEEPVFDKEKIFDEQIDPLLEKIRAICQEHSLPFVYALQFSNEKCKECGDHYVQGVCSGNYFPDGYAPDVFHFARRLLNRKSGPIEVSASVVQIGGDGPIPAGVPEPIKKFMEMMKKKMEE